MLNRTLTADDFCNMETSHQNLGEFRSLRVRNRESERERERECGQEKQRHIWVVKSKSKPQNIERPNNNMFECTTKTVVYLNCMGSLKSKSAYVFESAYPLFCSVSGVFTFSKHTKTVASRISPFGVRFRHPRGNMGETSEGTGVTL